MGPDRRTRTASRVLPLGPAVASAVAFWVCLSAGCADCDGEVEDLAPVPATERTTAPPETPPEEPTAAPVEPEETIFGAPGETVTVELDAEATARVDAVVEALRHSPHEVRARVAAKRRGGGAFVAVLHTYDQGAEWLGRRRTQGGWGQLAQRMARARRECEAELAEARSSGVPLEEYFDEESGGPPDCDRAEQNAVLPEGIVMNPGCERLHLVTVTLDAAGAVEERNDVGRIGNHRCFQSLESAAVWDADGDGEHDVVVDHTYLTGIGWGRGSIEVFHRVRALDFFVSSAESPDTLVVSKHSVVAYSLLEWASVGEYRFELADGAVQLHVDRATYSECWGEDVEEDCDEPRERQSALPWDAENHRFTREDRPIRAEEP